ncbi:MAG: hypothetical protein ACRBCT_05475 [Alphaproteobacteria bacterium]
MNTNRHECKIADRHCEERSDAAIQYELSTLEDGLLRFARNDDGMDV